LGRGLALMVPESHDDEIGENYVVNSDMDKFNGCGLCAWGRYILFLPGLFIGSVRKGESMNSHLLQIQTLLETIFEESGVCIKKIDIMWTDVTTQSSNPEKHLRMLDIDSNWFPKLK